jgi:hypothetical protein
MKWFGRLAQSTIFVMDDSANVDRALFAKAPKSVRDLNKSARAAARAKQRFAWALDNPDNPRVAGKPLKKPV